MQSPRAISWLRSVDAPLAIGFVASIAIHSALFAAARWWTPDDSFPPSFEVRSGDGAEAGAEDLVDDDTLSGLVVTIVAPDAAPGTEPQTADAPQTQALAEAPPLDSPIVEAEAPPVDMIEVAEPSPAQVAPALTAVNPITQSALALRDILTTLRAAIEQKTAEAFPHLAPAVASETSSQISDEDPQPSDADPQPNDATAQSSVPGAQPQDPTPDPKGLAVSSRGLSESASETPGQSAPSSSHPEGMHDPSQAAQSESSAPSASPRAAAGEGAEGAAGDQAAGTPFPSASNRPPTYPAEARRLRQQGTVILRLDVLADGSVASVEVALSSGFALLDTAAAQAARAWKFRAATIDSVAVRCEASIPVRFALRR